MIIAAAFSRSQIASVRCSRQNSSNTPASRAAEDLPLRHIAWRERYEPQDRGALTLVNRHLGTNLRAASSTRVRTQLSHQVMAAARRTPARKFLASLS